MLAEKFGLSSIFYIKYCWKYSCLVKEYQNMKSFNKYGQAHLQKSIPIHTPKKTLLSPYFHQHFLLYTLKSYSSSMKKETGMLLLFVFIQLMNLFFLHVYWPFPFSHF